MHNANAGEQSIVLRPVGQVVRTETGTVGDGAVEHTDLRAVPVQIVVDEAYAPGLLGIGPGSDLLVLFYFDRVDHYVLQHHPRDDESLPLRGVFATRTQYRPNPIGASSVRVLSVEGNVLHVVGVDAWDGTPVLDIKGHTPYFDEVYRDDT